ncbi:MAG: peptide chain release factor 1 [uncultured bacterium]|nr:MAG: peptide chain release factor 1 [uncultured bacterium]
MDDYRIALIEALDKKIQDTSLLLTDLDLKEMAELELLELKKQKDQIMGNYEKSGEESSEDSLDERNIILQVSGAAGGEEAKIWAEELLRMYSRFCELVGLKTEQVDEGVLRVSGNYKGKGPFNVFKYEAGVHRVQRIPATEKRGRVHTSTAAVSVLPELEDIDLHIRPEDVVFEAYRSGGHGGQNVNKVSTAVRIKHIPTSIVVTASTERFQGQNREIAMNLLRAQLWEIEVEKQHSEISSLKSTQVGRGMRSEKIRTYNFPQDRLTDHRINKSWHNLPKIMSGEIDDIVNADYEI